MRTLGICLVLSVLAACGVTPGRYGDAGPPTQTLCPAHADQCAGKCCGAQCLDTNNDPRNCGDCGTLCPSGTICYGGSCGCPPSGGACGSGQSCCGSLGCVSFDSDIRNCGGCGIGCGDGALCVGGKCSCGGVSCPSGQSCCGGACATSCAGAAGPDMAISPGGPPAGYCACSDKCASGSTHQCVDTDCCWENAFVSTTCKPKMTCAPWTYQ